MQGKRTSDEKKIRKAKVREKINLVGQRRRSRERKRAENRERERERERV